MHARSLMVALLLGGPLVTVVSNASAQGSGGARGLFLGAAVNGSVLDTDDPGYDSESGTGLFVQAGFGFTPKLALVLEGGGAAMQTDGPSWVVTHADFGLRYHFAEAGRRWAPFLDGALTAWAFTDEEAEFQGEQGELEFSGAGLTIGAGLLYFLGTRVALSGQVKFTKGQFVRVRFENVTAQGLHPGATSIRCNIGLTWFLGGTR